MYVLLFIAGRSFSILLLHCVNLFYKWYKKWAEYTKNVYFSSKQILALAIKWLPWRLKCGSYFQLWWEVGLLEKSSGQKQSNYPTKTPYKLCWYWSRYRNCVILNIFKTLGKSLASVRLTKGFAIDSLDVPVSKKYFLHSFQLSTHHHVPFLSV